MRPADAYRLKYRSGAAECQTIETSNDESNDESDTVGEITAGVDSLPDELLARILSPVDLKSLVQARAVCKSWKASVDLGQSGERPARDDDGAAHRADRRRRVGRRKFEKTELEDRSRRRVVRRAADAGGAARPRGRRGRT